MIEFAEASKLALNLILSLDADILEIVILSLKVSIFALAIACIIGFSLGSLLASNKFYGRGIILIMINSLMALPPVVVGLVVYMALSKSGPLGWLNILYTPSAMIVAQSIIITPIVLALSRQVIEDIHNEYYDYFKSLNLTKFQIVKSLIWDARYSLITVSLAGFGRGIAEVGAVIIVGGNINHFTRVMTTSIALETSMGNLPFALALGIILLLISLSVNALVMALNLTSKKYAFG
jgi:tungstate transport system permease protein